MTFDAGFDERVYTIIRNEDYGVLLPNEVLKPSVGDSVVLVGWNPRAINALDMVSRAEAELAEKARQYLDAVKSGQFTITTRMMSQWAFDLDAEGGYTAYKLLDAGAAVKVYHGGLPNGYKESRVLGYEYKLDMPFDTPTYTIGETEAYSRLKQIEKQLTKL